MNLLYRGCSIALFAWLSFADGMHLKGQESPTADSVRPAGASLEMLPGMQGPGRVLLPNGWSLMPQGSQSALGDFPVHILPHPNGTDLAILHSGYGEHEIITIDAKTLNKISRVAVPQAFYGMSFSSDGKWLIVSGGEDERVYVFSYDRGHLGNPITHVLARKTDKFVVSGLCESSDGASLYVCGLLGDEVKQVFSPFVASQAENDPDSLAASKSLGLPPGSYPYTCVEDKNRNRLYVSLWGLSRIAVVDLAAWRVIDTWKTKSHPTEMVLVNDASRLLVACSDENSVVILDAESGQSQEVLSTSLYPDAKNGSTPSAICVSPDERVLVAVNSGNNNLALFDISQARDSRSLGFVPVGWYPTNVCFDVSGEQILVTNGKGLASRDNRYGPNPLNPPPKNLSEYIGGLFTGSVSAIKSPTPTELSSMTKIAFQASPLRANSDVVEADRGPDNPVPARVGEPSPIEHCIYIIKENRTYDQVFGDMSQGNGDPSLCIFGETVTPNHHAIAREFVLLDNFYVDGEVSADGHEWTMAAYATDFVEKTWPLTYGKSRGKLTYPAEGATLIGQPQSGYLWNRCQEAGKSFFSFGEFIANGKMADEPARAKLPVLEGHFDPGYRSYDLDYSDLDRADAFIRRLKQFEQEDNLPHFISMHLPNDHTSGTRVGKLTPTAMVAQNDAALGRVVEAITQSKYWSKTAIFVIQDDAQNGSDHVDAHRSVALAISPYSRRGCVDSTMYSTTSMLRTMELILGLQPMSQFDAAAKPMFGAFQAAADLKPYRALAPQVDIHATNNALAWGADVSSQLDLDSPDAADDLILNEIVWRSVRGANSPMPPPVRAAFFFVSSEDEDEDEDEIEAESADEE